MIRWQTPCQKDWSVDREIASGPSTQISKGDSKPSDINRSDLLYLLVSSSRTNTLPFGRLESSRPGSISSFHGNYKFDIGGLFKRLSQDIWVEAGPLGWYRYPQQWADGTSTVEECPWLFVIEQSPQRTLIFPTNTDFHFHPTCQSGVFVSPHVYIGMNPSTNDIRVGHFVYFTVDSGFHFTVVITSVSEWLRWPSI